MKLSNSQLVVVVCDWTWCSWQVDYAPSYRVGGNSLDDHRTLTKRTKKSGLSGYTNWRDAEPLSTNDGLGLGGLDDYLLGPEMDIEEEAEDDIEGVDEDDLRLYAPPETLSQQQFERFHRNSCLEQVRLRRRRL